MVTISWIVVTSTFVLVVYSPLIAVTPIYSYAARKISGSSYSLKGYCLCSLQLRIGYFLVEKLCVTEKRVAYPNGYPDPCLILAARVKRDNFLPVILSCFFFLFFPFFFL